MRRTTGAAQIGQNSIVEIVVAPAGPAKGGARTAPDLRFILRPLRPGWRNWQTQWTQNPPDRKILAGSTPAPGTRLISVSAATFSGPRASKCPMPRISEISLPDDLVAAAGAGEAAAFEAVYARNLRRDLYAPAPARAPSRDRRGAAAGDFPGRARSISSAFEGRCPLPAWIRAIAVNRALMYLRSPWHRGPRMARQGSRRRRPPAVSGPGSRGAARCRARACL